MPGAGRSSSGAILVMALLVALLLLALGLAALWLATSGVRASVDVRARQEATVAAEAAVARARGILEQSFDWDRLLAGCSCVEEDVERIGAVLCDGLVCQRDVPVEGSADPAAIAARYTIWIRNDWMEECDVNTQLWDLREADCDDDGRPGTTEDKRFALKDHNGRVIVIVEGRGREGTRPVRLEAIITRRPGPSPGSGGYTQEGLDATGSNSLPGAEL